jgi:hypothetical protein
MEYVDWLFLRRSPALRLSRVQSARSSALGSAGGEKTVNDCQTGDEDISFIHDPIACSLRKVAKIVFEIIFLLSVIHLFVQFVRL